MKIRFKDGTEKEFKSLIDADLYGADLKGAYLKSANLYGADLRGADLRGADLRGAYLKSADLRDADLKGAYLEDTSIISANLGRHFAFFHEGYLKIGCEGRIIEDWLHCYKEIGASAKYSLEEIKLYKNFIKFVYKNVYLKQGKIIIQKKK